MFETFEHTADVGLRIRGATLEELFAEAGCALFSLIAGRLDRVQAKQRFDLRVAGSQHDYLLFDWLNELLYLFESRSVICSRFEVRLDPEGLSAVAWGEPLDPQRHLPEHEVKAITYHGLRVEPSDDGWLAEVIVDI